MSAHADDMIDAARPYNRPLLTSSERQTLETPMRFPHLPTTCPSMHHNPGNDVCDDCGFPLNQTDHDEAGFEALSPDEQLEYNFAEEDDVTYLRSPLGDEITGTLEVIPGTCDGTYEDGEFQHGGETDVGWDGQETVIRAGQRVFVEGDGTEWLESQLVKPYHPLPLNPVSPWDDIGHVDTFMREKVKEVLTVIAGPKAHFSQLQKTAMEIHVRTLANLLLEIRLQNQK